MKPHLLTGLILFALLLSSCLSRQEKSAHANELLQNDRWCKDTSIADEMLILHTGHLSDSNHCDSVGVFRFGPQEGLLFYGDYNRPGAAQMIDSVIMGVSMDILFKDLNDDGLSDIIVWSFYNKVTYSVYLRNGKSFKKLQLDFSYKEISQFKNSNYSYSYYSDNDVIESRLLKIDTSVTLIDSIKIPLRNKRHTFKDSHGKTFDTDVTGAGNEFVEQYWMGKLGLVADSGAAAKPWSAK
jgi:hypothetical protein